jgi:hypothetical protein
MVVVAVVALGLFVERKGREWESFNREADFCERAERRELQSAAYNQKSGDESLLLAERIRSERTGASPPVHCEGNYLAVKKDRKIQELEEDTARSFDRAAYYRTMAKEFGRLKDYNRTRWW